MPSHGCATPSRCWRKAPIRRNSSNTPRWSCSTIRCSASPQRESCSRCRATRAAVREQYAGLGRRIVERRCMRAKIVYADDKLKGALPRLARTSIDDVMAAVGRGEMKAADVARAMYPDYKEEARLNSIKGAAAKSKTTEAAKNTAIPIRGINSDLPIKFAPNGGAEPGDRIVGIVMPGEGNTIYPIQAPALKEYEEEPERRN